MRTAHQCTVHGMRCAPQIIWCAQPVLCYLSYAHYIVSRDTQCDACACKLKLSGTRGSSLRTNIYFLEAMVRGRMGTSYDSSEVLLVNPSGSMYV
jgi:hypothetical protein